MTKLDDDEVHVWIAVDTGKCPVGDEILSSEEKERLGRFRFERDRRQFALAHTFLRRVLSKYAQIRPEEWRFVADAGGKPEIVLEQCAGLFFNLSHTDGLAACAIARVPEVGVDVERISDCNLNIAEKFASDEREYLREHPDAFFEIWTHKEAFIKALGIGLSRPLDSFSVVHSGRICEPSDEWKFFQLDVDTAFAGAVAIHSKDAKLFRVECFRE